MGEKVKDKYGFLPTSVWHLKKDRKILGELVEDKKRKDIGVRRDTGGVFDGKGIRFSYFNPVLAYRVLVYWSEKNDLVLDPFAGRSTRGIITLELGRKYYGYEIAPITYELTKKQLGEKRTTLFSPQINEFEIFNSDGCGLKFTKDNSTDLIFTCPPYWKLERYESVKGQLSDCKTYEEFLEQMFVCFKNCFRVLKKGKFAIFVVNDFRLKGRFYLMHLDFIKLMEKVGFLPWDIVINKLNSPFLFAKIGECDEAKYTFKEHEYILVFKK